MKAISVFVLAAGLFSAAAQADVVADRLKEYQSQGGSNFSADAGKAMWTKKVVHADSEGKERACAVCHGEDLRKPGKHAKTGKVIDPLAPSANPERLTEVKQIEKWFKRNCEWTYGRECTAQEKGDFLSYIAKQ
ncbi:MAG: DUF1924 domain-containing protein [Gammaproteobacteria bacterium]|nr:DUF1924 domain-containing protein [Gammaproteobacteria bacterium]